MSNEQSLHAYYLNGVLANLNHLCQLLYMRVRLSFILYIVIKNHVWLQFSINANEKNWN